MRQDEACAEEVLAEECLDIADGRMPITYRAPNGSEVEIAFEDNHARIARDKLRIGARQWYCGKLSGCHADRLGPSLGRGPREEATFADLAKLAEQKQRG